MIRNVYAYRTENVTILLKIHSNPCSPVKILYSESYLYLRKYNGMEEKNWRLVNRALDIIIGMLDMGFAVRLCTVYGSDFLKVILHNAVLSCDI